MQGPFLDAAYVPHFAVIANVLVDGHLLQFGPVVKLSASDPVAAAAGGALSGPFSYQLCQEV